jgi:hypothetical protein
MSLLKKEIRLEAIRNETRYWTRQADSEEKRTILHNLLTEYFLLKGNDSKERIKPSSEFYRVHWEKAEKMVEELEDENQMLRHQLQEFRKVIETLS